MTAATEPNPSSPTLKRIPAELLWAPLLAYALLAAAFLLRGHLLGTSGLPGYRLLPGLVFFVLFTCYARLKWGLRSAYFSLLSLTVFPSSFYLLTADAYVFSLIGLCGYLLLAESSIRGRSVWMALCAFLSVLITPATVWFAMVPMLREWPHKKNVVLGLLPFVLGLGVVEVLSEIPGFTLLPDSVMQVEWDNPLPALMQYFQERPLVAPENILLLLTGVMLALFASRKLEAGLWVFLLMMLLSPAMSGSVEGMSRHCLLAFPLHYLFAVSEKALPVKLSFACFSALLGLRVFMMLYFTGALA